ncbi:hypothetical protein CDAR_216431 [Caerostris darwini]|uniref:Uncharacterized protein n=1 Tax=Caerostris darwini TaxID=1538125 RepID=A0AAV4UB69_9ARAC|nr:hypothetical protein CDAR_216431 [Caerostris darwini]
MQKLSNVFIYSETYTTQTAFGVPFLIEDLWPNQLALLQMEKCFPSFAAIIYLTQLQPVVEELRSDSVTVINNQQTQTDSKTTNRNFWQGFKEACVKCD